MALNAFGYMRRKIYPHYTIRSNTETYLHSHQGQNFTAARYVLHCTSGLFFIWKKMHKQWDFINSLSSPSSPPPPGIFEKVAPVAAVLTLHANAISKAQFNLKYCTL